MITEPKVYVHIPDAGRCGSLLSLKNDIPYCVRLRDALKDEFGSVEAVKSHDPYNSFERALDENDMCGCPAFGQGVVWSQVMSAMPDDGDQYWEEYMLPLSDRDRQMDEEDMEHYVVNEARMRERIMTQDVSLSSGEEYQR